MKMEMLASEIVYQSISNSDIRMQSKENCRLPLKKKERKDIKYLLDGLSWGDGSASQDEVKRTMEKVTHQKTQLYAVGDVDVVDRRC